MTLKDGSEDLRTISAVLHVADTEKEVSINVASGFPNDILDKDEIIISEGFARYLGFKKDPKTA